jgi:hypothetical protein
MQSRISAEPALRRAQAVGAIPRPATKPRPVDEVTACARLVSLQSGIRTRPPQRRQGIVSRGAAAPETQRGDARGG